MRLLCLLWLWLFLWLTSCLVPYEVLTSASGQANGQSSSLSAGEGHTCAVVRGALWCWGANSRGQLGNGTSTGSLRPRRAGADETWVKVRTGTAHSCALKADGSIWCWGSNADGELGQGDIIDRAIPTQVPLAIQANDIELKSNFSCALLSDQSLWCWGDNTEGQLGLGDAARVDELKPRQVPLGAGCASMAAGQGHFCAIRSDGTLRCWGRNTESQLGFPVNSGVQFRAPRAVGTQNDWLAIDANQKYTCGLKSDRSLWCWGELPNGVLVEEPKLFAAGQWTSVRTNTFHACAVFSSGEARCWGRNVEGQLGLGDMTARANPTALSEKPVLEIAAGRFHTCQRRSDETIWCSGANDVGQLGLGDTMRRNMFSEVQLTP